MFIHIIGIYYCIYLFDDIYIIISNIRPGRNNNNKNKKKIYNNRSSILCSGSNSTIHMYSYLVPGISGIYIAAIKEMEKDYCNSSSKYSTNA